MRTLWEAFDVARPTHAHIHSSSSSHGQTHTYPCVLARRLMDAQPRVSRQAHARTETSPDPLSGRMQRVQKHGFEEAPDEVNARVPGNGTGRFFPRKSHAKSQFLRLPKEFSGCSGKRPESFFRGSMGRNREFSGLSPFGDYNTKREDGGTGEFAIPPHTSSKNTLRPPP